MFYRYERDGIGILQWIKLNSTKENWDIIRLDVNTWLNGHDEYKESYRSYFTERGYKKCPNYIKAAADTHIKVEKLNNVVYADEYQVIIDTEEEI